MSTQRDTSHNGERDLPEPPTESSSSGESLETIDWHREHESSHKMLFILALVIIALQVLNALVITYGLVTR